MEDFNQFGEPVQNVNPGQNTNQSQNGNYMQGMNPGQYGNYAQGMYQANGTGNNQFSQKKKKNAGFGKGLGLGVLLGGTVAILGGFLMIKGYAGHRSVCSNWKFRKCIGSKRQCYFRC